MKAVGARVAAAVVAVFTAVLLTAAPASAHILVVDPPGSDEVKTVWVGGGALPGQGKGLVPGGPGGTIMQSPAHNKGLNTACEAIRAAGVAAVDIFGPPTPAGCAHGT